MKKAILFVICIIYMVVVFGQQLKKVAVFDPEGEISQGVRHIVREEISNAIVNTPNYAVVERSMIEKVLAEAKFQSGGLVDDTQISELGRMMGADYVTYGSMAEIGDNYYISLKMVDVVTARVMLQKTGTTEDGLNDLIQIVESLAYQLVNKTGRTKEEMEARKKKQESLQKINRSKNIAKNTGLSKNASVSAVAISVITGNAIKTTIQGLAESCKQELSSLYNCVPNSPSNFRVKAGISQWSKSNNVDYVICLGQNIGKKIVINIYDAGKNQYKYIYTSVKVGAANDIEEVVKEIKGYIGN